MGLAPLLLAGCSLERIPVLEDLPSPAELPWVYRIDVQQGNVVTQEMLDRLKRGMDKRKVRFIMGTPLVTDTFHQDRWDYIYTFRKGTRWTREQRRISLYFEDGKLARIEGNVQPATKHLQVPPRTITKVVVPGEYEEGFLARMKESIGLGNDDKEHLPGYQPKQKDATATQPTQPSTTGQGKTGSEPAPDSVTVPPETVTYKEEEEHNKGFFRRMLEKIGIGDNEDEQDYEPADPKYKDPSNPDPAAGDPNPL